MNDDNVLAQKIVNLREAQNMTQVELSEKTGIERTKLNKIEKGTRKVSSDELKQIAIALGQSADSLLDMTDDPSPASSDTKHVDLKDPVVLSYGGRPISDDDMKIIKAILERHNDK